MKRIENDINDILKEVRRTGEKINLISEKRESKFIFNFIFIFFKVFI
jgi:hypothetical protein